MLAARLARDLSAFALFLASPLLLGGLRAAEQPGLVAESQHPAAPSSTDQPSSPVLTGFVVPVQMVKLTLTPPDSSNRLELNHLQPLHRWSQSFLFLDNTIYAKARPSGAAGAGLPAVETWGESFRVGYRHLTDGGRGFLGLNGGYDNSWQQGYYFQQLGLGLEATYPGLAAAATLTHAVGRSYYLTLGKSLLSSFNIQAAFPIGIPNLSMATRYYYVYDQLGQSAPGGQLQLSYGVNRSLSMTLSASYDHLDGLGSSLQFKYLFHPPRPSQVPATVPYSIASPFSQAIGNTGSRIIRLSGSPPAYGD